VGLHEGRDEDLCKRCAKVTNGKARSYRLYTFKFSKPGIEGGSTGSADTAEGVKKRACGKTTANASASCNLPRSCGQSNCKRRSRGAFVEYILFTAEYVLGSLHFKVTSADVRVNISRSTVASRWSVTIDLGREGTPSRQPVLLGPS